MDIYIKETIAEFIEDKDSFSIPYLQSELNFTYGEIREAITELEKEKKVEFLGGIVYKWAPPQTDFDEDDDDEMSLEEVRKSIAKEIAMTRKRVIRKMRGLDSRFPFDDDDDDDDDAFLFDDTALDSDSNLLLVSNGGPIPNVATENVSITQFIAQQREYNLQDKSFSPRLNVTIPDINEKLMFHAFERFSNWYIHDGGIASKYIRSKALGLEEDMAKAWYDLIVENVPRAMVSCKFGEDRLILSVDDYAPLTYFEERVSHLSTTIGQLIAFTDYIIKRQNRIDTLKSFHVPFEEYDRIATALLDSGVEFENLTEVVEKILEIYPEATSEIVNKVLMRCAAVALRREDENAEKIIEFYGKVKNNYTYSLTVYFIMKQVENI